MKTDPPRLAHLAIDRAKSDLPSSDALAKIAQGLPFGPIGGSGGSSGSGASGLSTTLAGALVGGALGVVVLGAWVVGATLGKPDIPAIVSATSASNPSPVTTSRPSASGDHPVAKPAEAAPSRPKEQHDHPTNPAPSLGTTSVGATPEEAAGPPMNTAPPSETEAAILQRAEDALAADPAHALAICEEHAKRFQGGLLGQEREMIAVTALLAQGNAAAAHARGARLLASFPGSAYRRRLEVLLPDLKNDDADHKNPSAPPSTP
jgi:hypothetical protein